MHTVPNKFITPRHTFVNFNTLLEHIPSQIYLTDLTTSKNSLTINNLVRSIKLAKNCRDLTN